MISFALLGCAPRVSRLQGDFLSENKTEPSISGDGQKLAFIVNQNGRSTVQLRDLSNNDFLPLRHFSRDQPHSSPALSWNARYLAVIAQTGSRYIIIIEDRQTGNNFRIPIPGDRLPTRLTLAPDATKLAIQVTQQGKWHIELFDLTNFLEPDRPLGINNPSSY